MLPSLIRRPLDRVVSPFAGEPRIAGRNIAIRLMPYRSVWRARRRSPSRAIALHGNVAELRIADVAVHVRISQLFRFDHGLQRVGGVLSPLRERKSLHDVEHLQRGDALAVRRDFVDGPAVVSGRNRLDPFARIIGQIRRASSCRPCRAESATMRLAISPL